MNFDKLEQAIIRYRESLARFRNDREALRALGVTDLPGDEPAPRCLNPHFPPGNLPGEPTDAMIEAAMHAQPGGIQPAGIGLLSGPELARILRAALAAAPRVEVPEITEEDCQAVYVRCQELQKAGTMNTHEPYCDIARLVRARLIARMGAKS